MTSNLEQLKKELDGLYVVGQKRRQRVRELIEKSYKAGTLNCLDKAIELLPQETWSGGTDRAEGFMDGFNNCRSQILSRIEEARKEIG